MEDRKRIYWRGRGGRTLKPSIKSVILIKNVSLSQIDCKTMKMKLFFRKTMKKCQKKNNLAAIKIISMGIRYMTKQVDKKSD